ncbi:MAG: bifunctional phosphopantothenoylcysteine decarboxylase/phosphopantothenate--cysteine ligase CoaBC [Anaerolineales bacterium]
MNASVALLRDRAILLGVTGSIAVYKAVDLASKLTQAGARVDVVMTGAATKFVTPLTFQSVTGRQVYADLWGDDAHVIHIGLAEAADLLVIAPCTADTMARMVQGRADDLLALTALAARCPLLLAPAMDGGMWENAATQANVGVLRERGVRFAGPAEGRLASGLIGAGRMAEPAELLGYIRLVLAKGGPLAGRKVVVTAGGTQEALDPVRYISNHSSGKQGFALAQAALDRGAQVSVVTAPVALEPPVGAELRRVRSAAEMAAAVHEATADADVLLMAAAVADFRPAHAREQKIKRAGDGIPQIDLERTPDILAVVSEQRARTGNPKVVVGFAAESQNLAENALKKLQAKGLALIVANDITGSDAGFFVDTNRVLLLDAGGGREQLPLLSKTEVAEIVCDRVAALLGSGQVS